MTNTFMNRFGNTDDTVEMVGTKTSVQNEIRKTMAHIYDLVLSDHIEETK